MKRNRLLLLSAFSSVKMRYKWRNSFPVIVALMYLYRIPQELGWNDLTDNYVLETKRPCMRTRTVRFGISIIALFYWRYFKKKVLISENYDILMNLTVKEMVRFTEKYFVKDIPAAFEFADNQMHGNELLNAFPFDSSNSWVKEINIEDFNFSLLGNNLIHCIINKEGYQVMIYCTYAKKDGPLLVS